MNTLTRGEKIDRAINEVKTWTVRILLIAWAFVTMALGICYGIERRHSAKLEERLERVESMTGITVEDLKDVKAIYIRR